CEISSPVRAGLQKENVMDVNMLLESVRESLHQVGVFLPRLLLAIVILVVGWVIAKAVRFAVVKALRAINFGVVTEKAGIDHFLKQGGAHIDTVRVLGGLAYWLVILAALMGLGLALAFGLGGQRRAGEVIERWSRPGNGDEPTTRNQTKPVL